MGSSASTSLRSVYIVDGIRTPIGKWGGSLATVRPDDMAALCLQTLMQRQEEVASRIDHVVMGDTNQAGESSRNVARIAALLAGLSFDVPAVTVNRLCGSGLEAISAAARMIMVGEVQCALAGGVESMTRAPYVMAKPDRAFTRAAPKVYDSSIGWRFPNPKLAERMELCGMGETAENVASKHGISREDQDAFALLSHQRAAEATEAGRFDAEIVPVSIPQRKADPVLVTRDEGIRPDTSLDKLAKLRPAFRQGGTVTAGNSSSINDGAAAVMLVAGNLVEELGLTPIARIVGSATVGVDPNFMGEGPIGAVRAMLKRADLRVPNVDLVELNEAFAAQALACIRVLGLNTDKVNVNGGAIALGHPIGCSGARIMVTLLNTMKQREARTGLATLCIGVGQGIAMLLERP